MGGRGGMTYICRWRPVCPPAVLWSPVCLGPSRSVRWLTGPRSSRTDSYRCHCLRFPTIYLKIMSKPGLSASFVLWSHFFLILIIVTALSSTYSLCYTAFKLFWFIGNLVNIIYFYKLLTKSEFLQLVQLRQEFLIIWYSGDCQDFQNNTFFK